MTPRASAFCVMWLLCLETIFDEFNVIFIQCIIMYMVYIMEQTYQEVAEYFLQRARQ